jgi:spermidine synthase
LIYVDESVSGTVTIHETSGGFRVIDINGLNVAGTKFGFLCTQKLQAHYPLLMHPDPEQIMQIGFGTGGTCFSVSTHPEVERIDCVEINPGIIEAAPFFFENNQDILSDERVQVNIEDARNFVLSTNKRYDIILSDSIHPRFTGNGLLYTADYFELCSEIMEEDGIFSTWLPTGFLGDEEFRVIVRSMQSVFPHILVWYMNNTVEGYTITMGSRRPFRVDFDELAERMARPALAEDLEQVRIGNPHELLDCILLSGDRVAEYLDDGLLNTEDRPIIEFRAPRNMNRIVTEFRNLERMMQYRNFPATVIGWGNEAALATERRETLQRYYLGTGYILAAHQYHLLSKVREEAVFLSRAIEANPDDRDAPFLAERLREMLAGRKVDW